MGRFVAAGAVALALAVAGGGAAGEASAAVAAVAIPNPCGIAPVGLVAPALGVAKTAVHATLQKSKVDGFDISTCVFLHGSSHVSVTLAPAAYGSGTASIPGLVVTHPSGLGPEGKLLQDSSKGDVFASAVFVKDGLWGEAYSNAHVQPATVLALGRYAYAHVG